MFGKILKVSSNDLYGNVDDRQVVVFAAFNHMRYMNKYVIFTFKGEYDKNKLYYGSLHLKNDSLVIFSVEQMSVNAIEIFLNSYLNRYVNVNEYSMIDISSYNKVELISYNSMDFDKLELLDTLSIPRVVENSGGSVNGPSKKSPILKIILVLIILLGIGITYVYLNADKFFLNLKELNCSINGFNKNLGTNYTREIIIGFDQNGVIKSNKVITTYKFSKSDDYLNFKDNDWHLKYFDVSNEFTYNDNTLELKVGYVDNHISGNVIDVRKGLAKEGYACLEE